MAAATKARNTEKVKKAKDTSRSRLKWIGETRCLRNPLNANDTTT